MIEAIGTWVGNSKENMIDSLKHLLQIPSVRSAAAEAAPFGAEAGRALEYMLQLGVAAGFSVANVDGYAGHIEYGEGDEYVAVLAHLDVVPAGQDWTYPPFAAEIHDGRIYARGAIDDKGPAMSAFWALSALKACSLRPKRKIRLILGLDEESGWECMQHYFNVQPLPLGGFSPDADFPIIYAEKGVLTLQARQLADAESMSPRIVSFTGGERTNMVPDVASAVVECHSETAAEDWEQKAYRQARQQQADFEIQRNGSRVQVVAHGVSAHGSTPRQGVNAIVELAGVLAVQPVSNVSMWRQVAAQDCDGKALGIACADAVSGELTSNLGTAKLEGNAYVFHFNIRHPIDRTKEELLQQCREYVSGKWEITLLDSLHPLYVAPEHPVIKGLSATYEEHTGQPAQLLAIGGATYARSIPNAVAFGPLFPGEPELAHQRDESWALENYFRCAEIYAHAMWELANTL